MAMTSPPRKCGHLYARKCRQQRPPGSTVTVQSISVTIGIFSASSAKRLAISHPALEAVVQDRQMAALEVAGAGA